MLPGEGVEWDLLGTGNLDNAVHRFAQGELGQRCHDIIRRDGLQKSRRQMDLVSFDGRLDDPTDELEELGRSQDRKGNLRSPDEPLLRHLGAKIAAFGKAIGTDYRERHVVTYAGGRFGGKQVAARGLEELENRLVLERRRIRHVDDDAGAG